MKLKRIRYKNNPSPIVVILSGERWVPLELILPKGSGDSDRKAAADLICALQAGPVDRQNWQDAADDFSGPVPPMDETPILPFQPLPYRDFMLFENQAIAQASLKEQPFPGEFVATGTLPGGCGMENGRWVKPGDVLELKICCHRHPEESHCLGGDA